jgi:5-oxoprolinase (ATP-hydrolysing)
VNWPIAADTGGTFTDCHALDPQGRESRCKVLSTGHLRATLADLPLPAERGLSGENVIRGEGWGEGHKIRLSGLPPLPKGLLRGFSIRSLTHHESRLISSHNENGQITLDSPPPAEWHAGALVELFTGEEAPVLGARILTNTPPGTAFPPMQTPHRHHAGHERASRTQRQPHRPFHHPGLRRSAPHRRSTPRDLFALRHEPRPIFHELVCEVPSASASMAKCSRRSMKPPCALWHSIAIAKGITTAAVCLMHGHAHPAHELRVGEILREAASRMSCFLTSDRCFREAAAPHAEHRRGCVSARAGAVVFECHPQCVARHACHDQRGRTQNRRRHPPEGHAAQRPGRWSHRCGERRAPPRPHADHHLDMGGTSTDVARIDTRPGYRFTPGCRWHEAPRAFRAHRNRRRWWWLHLPHDASRPRRRPGECRLKSRPRVLRQRRPAHHHGCESAARPL